MNAPLNAMIKQDVQVAIKPEYKQQAAAKGLFRLLRSVLREQMFSWQSHETGICLTSIKGCLVLAKPQYDSLGALRTYRSLTWYGNGKKKDITDPVTALNKLLTVTDYQSLKDEDPWQRISNELQNSMKNEALTIDWRTYQDELIREQCEIQGVNNLLCWSRYAARQQSSQCTAVNSAILIEQWSAVGHPYHPGSKTKLGLSVREVLNYSPEFNNSVPLVLIAVHRSLLKVTTLSPDLNYCQWFANTFRDWYQQWFVSLQDNNGFNADDYLPVPVHPWQLEHRLPDLFSVEIQQQKIVLSGPSFPALATLSCRTLAPGTNASLPYIKLPVAAQMTSSVRNLSASSVDNAPRIAAVLQDILTLRSDIASVLRFQWDEVGLHTCVDTKERDNDRYLSVIFRRNPGRLITENEHAVVVAALFSESPLSSLCEKPVPLFIELMLLSGVRNNSQAIRWFSHYVDTLLTALLSLLLEYGLALEAHQQNMMVVFTDKGELRGFLNRDVGGICIHKATLSDRGWPINFTDSAVFVETTDETRANFSHTVLQSHIGELISLAEGYFDLTAEALWLQVSALLQKHIQAHGDKYGEQALQHEMEAFFRQPWPGTAFLRMRLQGQSEYAQSQPVRNPLTEGIVA